MSLTKMQRYADELERQKTGYDQGERWSFNPARDGQSVTPYRETDCSAGCAAIIRAGGYPLDTRDPIYTGNFYSKTRDVGFTAINVYGKNLAEIVSLLQPGDFLLGPGHVIFAYTPTKWWSAENDEYGRKSGGLDGDQTGLESRFRSPYLRSRGWAWLLRAPDLDIPVVPPLVATKPIIEGVKPRAIDWRSTSGEFVKIVQEISGSAVDGIRGRNTISAVKRLQKRLGVRVDGYFGAGTAEAYLLTTPNLYRGRGGMPTGAVKLIQWIVRSRVDGQFGGLTEADVKSAQAWAGLFPDGNVGDESKKKLTF